MRPRHALACMMSGRSDPEPAVFRIRRLSIITNFPSSRNFSTRPFLNRIVYEMIQAGHLRQF